VADETNIKLESILCF